MKVNESVNATESTIGTVAETGTGKTCVNENTKETRTTWKFEQWARSYVEWESNAYCSMHEGGQWEIFAQDAVAKDVA